MLSDGLHPLPILLINVGDCDAVRRAKSMEGGCLMKLVVVPIAGSF